MIRQFISVLILAFVLAAPVTAQQAMSDQQVLEYVKAGKKQGKDERQIASELTRRGVTKLQAMRVKKMYEQQAGDMEADSQSKDGNRSRLRQNSDNLQNQKWVKKDDLNFDRRSPYHNRNKRLARDQRYQEGGMDFMEMPDNTYSFADDYMAYEDPKDRVYGRDIFETRDLTFEPSVNLATPPNYRLGPGDEVIVDIWGTNQATIRDQISPDGTISIPDLGLITLNGMTVAEATDYLRKELNKIYAGLDNGQSSASQIKVTLGNSRTIQVNVMGEVFQPGTYALSSFSTVFHALYRAGGVSDIGSLRNIQVVRAGRNIATVDVYDFIMKGKVNDDIHLQEGDVIIVPPYQALVQVEGNVKRPMKYEMKTNEGVATLLKYAGGFAGDAYTRSLRLVRQNGREYQVYTIDDIDYSVFQLKDGDVLTAEAILDRYENKLEIKGAVYRPGIYQYSGNLNTVRQLVEKADGLMGDAFTGRAVLHRERENLTREVIQVDIKGIMAGVKPDIPLQRNDVLYIPSIHDLKDIGSVTVFGEVARPGEFPYADNTTLEDIIIQAGGLMESASTVRVDVSRRIKNPKSTETSATIGEMFSFSLKDGFVIDGTPGFVLQPYDQIYVRRSPGYQPQVNVSIDGEVLYDGDYSLTSKSERLSDLVKKAGGVTQFAYVKGSKLVRKANEDELKRMQDVLKMMKREMGVSDTDSLKLELDSVFSVGINLEQALKAPGSSADIVLREGDKLVVPELNNTVKINGAVMYPNTVSYNEGKSVKYYLSQAGGFANNARKSKAFIVYMNGQVAEVKGSSKHMVEPGCEIIVPSKNKSKGIGNALAIASSVGSLGMMIATIANLMK